MISSEQFTEMVYGFWARRFDYGEAMFDRPCTYIFEEETLQGKMKTNLYQIGAISILRIGPDLLAQLDLPSIFPCAIKAIGVDDLQEVLNGRFRITVQDTLLDWFLDAKNHIHYAPPDGFTMRRLDGVKEDATLQAFYATASQQDLEAAEIYLDEPDPVIFGLFDADGTMAAYASHRYWEDLLCDIGVLVGDGYRGKGLGKAVVSALCDWCIANQKIPMYRVFDNNPHSLAIPGALGFQLLVTIDTLEISTQ